jgi:hypothetical protein
MRGPEERHRRETLRRIRIEETRMGKTLSDGTGNKH